jgi:putative ABC transport system permease protein
MLKNFLTVAWRNIQRHKGYAFIHVLGLGVGICACMSIWTITHYELSFDKFHPDRDRIYRVVTEIGQTSGEHAYWGDVPEPAEPAIRAELTGLETVAQFHNINPMITIPGEHGQVRQILKIDGGRWNDVVLAEPQYFDIFKYQWVKGDPATLKEPYHVVLTTGAAERFFGHSDPEAVLGRTLIYDDSVRVTVTGLVKDLDQVTDFTFTQFISYATGRAKLANVMALDQWGSSNSASETFVKLEKGMSIDRADAEMKSFTARHRKEVMGDNNKTFLQFRLQPLSDLHYSTDYDKNYGREVNLKTLHRLMWVAAFILILASINFINLSTAQSIRRAKEIGIRKVLGSRRAGLVLQFMSETLILSMAALLLSLLLLQPLLTLFPSFIPPGLRFDLLDPATIGTALGVVLAAALLSGLYPALVISGYQPAQSLKGEARTPGSGQSWLAKGLVIFQFTISAIFIIAAIVVGNQMRYMLHKDLGYNQTAGIRFDGDYADPGERKDLFAQRIRNLPGVLAVSRDALSPTVSGWSRSTFEWKPGTKIDVDIRTADTNYLSVYGMKLLAGRNYFYRGSDTLQEYVITNSLAKMLGYRRPQDAVGQTPLPFGTFRPVVVGVVADFATRSAQFGITPAMIYPDKFNMPGFSVKLNRTGSTLTKMAPVISAIEKTWKDVFPNEPFRYHWTDDSVRELYDSETKMAALINLAMIITIVVSGMGLFGLAALAAGKRTKEIGIRKVLGAGVGNITAMITRDFVGLVVVALIIASPVAWYLLHGWLADYEYRVGMGWWIYGLAAVLAIGVAVLTVGFHAVRAALASPTKSLRSE